MCGVSHRPYSRTPDPTAWVEARPQKFEPVFIRNRKEISGRVLLQNAVNYLHRIYVALFHGRFTLFEPADIRTERNAVVTDFAFFD